MRRRKRGGRGGGGGGAVQHGDHDGGQDAWTRMLKLVVAPLTILVAGVVALLKLVAGALTALIAGVVVVGRAIKSAIVGGYNKLFVAKPNKGNKAKILQKMKPGQGGGRGQRVNENHMKGKHDILKAKGGDEPGIEAESEADVETEPKRVKQKRKSKKDYMPEDSDYEVGSDATKTPYQILQDTYCKMGTTLLKNVFKLPRQTKLEDIKVFQIPANFTQADLERFYNERREWSRKTYRFQIPVVREDGTTEFIPVTPSMEENLADRRYFIVEFLGQEARGRVLCEEYSLYSVAVQTVPNDKDPVKDAAEFPWAHFSEAILGPVIEHKVRIENYGCSYTRVESASIYDGLGEELIAFYATFSGELGLAQQDTEQGKVYFDTTFVLCSEAERFAIVEEYVIYIMGRIPAGVAKILRVWSKLSKCVFWIQIYLLELGLAAPHMSIVAASTAKKTRLKWANAQFKIKGCGLDFFPKVESICQNEGVKLADGLKMEDVVLDENLKRKLCGGQGLHILNQNDEMSRMIVLRLFGFTGSFENAG